MRCGAPSGSSRRAAWTCTSGACGKKSKPTRRNRRIRRPCAGLATFSRRVPRPPKRVGGAVRLSLFWRLALTYFALLLAVLLAVDVYIARPEFRQRLWAASLAILLVGGGAALLASRSFSARIGRLKAFSRRVADGDFRPLAAERAGDELAELARALNETAARMDQTIRSLTDERNRSAAILRSMVEGVAVISADERIVFSNQAFSQILGLDPAGAEGRRPVEVIRQPGLLEVIRQVLAGRESVHSEVVMGTVRPRSFGVTAAPVLALGATEGRSSTTGCGGTSWPTSRTSSRPR